ncbi:MAG: BstXI family restriction endonuclease [Bacteroidales bacterium]|nr:BstXI family restriction endonuclease [Bacteroidales bacterium]
MANRLPPLPKLLDRKIYKTGQTRGADDDVIYQNRVKRNSTVLIPINSFNNCAYAPDNQGIFENDYIVLIKPEEYFENSQIRSYMEEKDLVLGLNSLLFYETRYQWNAYNPTRYNLNVASSRIAPLGGEYVARVPSTTSKDDEKINLGFITSEIKGAGIRVYEYASSDIIKKCQLQLEYLYWSCPDSIDISLKEGMTKRNIEIRKSNIELVCNQLGLLNKEELKKIRVINDEGHTTCPLCLEKILASGFYNRLEQADGRDVPDLTVTQVSLFHIVELRTGVFNHQPYNLGWGHHFCNVVCKDSGINDTLLWMKEVLARNRL